MMPPRCPVTGKHIRWLLLLAFLSYFIYFIVHGLGEPPSTRTVYICDTNNHSELTQCRSSDDVTTCAGMTDADGNPAGCIESSCGYRLFPHIDVSIAGSAEPYDAEAASAPRSFWSVVSIIYSLVPYVVGFAYLVRVLALGDLVSLTRLVVLGVISVPNELVFKRLIEQDRPLGSCLYFTSHGMPSGHAATSIGLLAYLLLELFVYHPNVLCGLTCQKKEQQNQYSFKLGYGWQRQTANNEDQLDVSHAPVENTYDSLLVNMSDGVEAGESEKYGGKTVESRPMTSSPSSIPCHWLALCYFILLFPVPFSRVYLHDHLRNQVLVGSCVGMVISSMWYLGFVRNCGMRVIEWRTSEWGTWWGLTLGHSAEK